MDNFNDVNEWNLSIQIKIIEGGLLFPRIFYLNKKLSFMFLSSEENSNCDGYVVVCGHVEYIEKSKNRTLNIE